MKRIKRYHLTIPDRPRPKGRPRFGRGGRAFTPKETTEYEKKIRNIALENGVQPLVSDNLTFTVIVYVRNRVHGDVDNYVKIASDALNGVAFKDDKQIKHVHGHLYYDANERMEITISETEETYESAIANR